MNVALLTLLILQPVAVLENVPHGGPVEFPGGAVYWQIPIPNNYDCDDTSALGCWVRLQFVYPNGTSVQDTTTWSAYILGEPVRIIQ